MNNDWNENNNEPDIEDNYWNENDNDNDEISEFSED